MNPRRRIPRPVLAVVAALAVSPAASGQGGVFDIAGRRAERAVVTIEPDGPMPADDDTPMTRRLAGVLADLRGRDLLRLRACVPPSPFLGDPTGGERIAVVHLFRGVAAHADKRVELVRARDGGFVAVELDATAGRPARAELDRDAAAELVRSWPAYRGGFDAPACIDPVGEVFEVPRPYTPGWFVMDKPTMGRRFLQRDTTNLDATDRQLNAETLFARLPRGYDPRVPAGLLVWIDATPDGRPPQVFDSALDRLGVICVGAADIGNDRYVASRYQLALDAVATATRRYHVDPRRVYLSGFSGGGRVASQLLACFPDVFTGAVPIVGLSHYAPVPTGTGSAWPAGYVRPDAATFRLFQTRPLAPITGSADFNHREIEHAVHLMLKDRLDVRLFDNEEMAHELPTPERFLEALAWVDRVYEQARGAEADAAAKAMATYLQRFGDAPPRDAAGRRLLLRVTEAGPWTVPAWRAAELLGQP